MITTKTLFLTHQNLGLVSYRTELIFLSRPKQKTEPEPEPNRLLNFKYVKKKPYGAEVIFQSKPNLDLQQWFLLFPSFDCSKQKL